MDYYCTIIIIIADSYYSDINIIIIILIDYYCTIITDINIITDSGFQWLFKEILCAFTSA